MGNLAPEFSEGHVGILTSGSTGTPKLVIGAKQRAEALAEEIHARQRLDAARGAVLALPLAYSYSLVNQWVWAHLHRLPLMYTRGLADPRALFSALDRADGAMLCLVGSQVPLLRRHLADGRTFPGVVRLNFAGGPFPQKDLPWIACAFPSAEIYHNYGCTEAMPRLTIRQAEDSSEPMILGHPLAGVSLRLGEGDRLEFRSPYGAVAIADVAGVRRIGANEWIDTGDVACAEEDGRYRLLGRRSEVFKRHGEKISVAAIGSALREVWLGQLAFLFETAADGETGHVAVVSPTPDAIALRQILLTLRNRFRRPHWPIRIEAVSTIPLTPNGKLDLIALGLAPRAVLWKQIL